MKIFCDSSCDLLKGEMEELGVNPIVFPSILDGEEDTRLFASEEDYTEFYRKIRSGKSPSTASINAYTFEEIFSPILKSGEDILYIHLSSGLTGTFDYVPQIINDLKQQFPNRKVYFVDSLHVTMAIGLLVRKAVELQKQGKTIDEIRDYLEVLKNKIACYFAPENLFYLKKGGRISLAAAVGGTLLNVKPICKANDEGKIVKIGVVPGKRGAIKKLAQIAKENMRPSEFPIVIMHADKKEDALALKAELAQVIPNKEVEIRPVGPTIGTHCGPGTLAVVFYADHR